MAWDSCKCGCSRRGPGIARGWRAALLALLLLAMAGSTGAQGASPRQGVRVVVELFQVVLTDAEHIRYLRQERVLDRRGPDAAVAELLQGPGKVAPFLAGTPAIVHSTSWRYESYGTVVLTYLAFGERCSPESKVYSGARTVAKGLLPGLGPTDPDHPRPTRIEHEDVLSHGLRHLAFLARRQGANQAFLDRLGERSRSFFVSLEPEIAGQLGTTEMTVSPRGQAR
jgi:hypothetical protein